MPTYTTYDTVGIKEDVSNTISNLTPTKTPFLSLIGSDTTKSRKFEWLEDSLADPKDNAQVEGFEASDATLSPPEMRENYTQILEKTFKISETEDAVDQHGRARETAYQTVKAGKELKRDLEYAYIGRDQAGVLSTSDVARRTASATKMVDADVTVNAGGAAFTEAHLLEAGQKGYTEGAEPTYLMIKPTDALVVAGFTNAAGRTRDIDGDSRKIVNVVDLYVSPFGEYKVILNRYQLSSVAWLLDPSMWKNVTLRGWSRTPLAKTGDSNRQMLVGEFGLKNTNFKSSPLITGLL
ncbi:SU10 major capsid protein [Novosphingobium clariflavum]|uniref:DUF5309 family protein n=1 Tax=Novosphingobium clariflavum TaxID=2029884 RepID=A0ABV6SCB5_9SPHN|nr:DUF5309 family protein [Novosphingobium clariflavum]